MSVILAGWLSDKIGRRKAFVSFCTIGVVGFWWLTAEMSQLPSTEPSGYETALIGAFAMCCMGFGVNGVMGVFTPELFQPTCEAQAQGLARTSAKALGV